MATPRLWKEARFSKATERLPNIELIGDRIWRTFLVHWADRLQNHSKSWTGVTFLISNMTTFWRLKSERWSDWILTRTAKVDYRQLFVTGPVPDFFFMANGKYCCFNGCILDVDWRNTSQLDRCLWQYDTKVRYWATIHKLLSHELHIIEPISD